MVSRRDAWHSAAMKLPTDGQASAQPDKLILQGVHMDLTPALQSGMRDRLAPLLRHNEWIVRIHVRLQQTQTLGSKRLFSVTGQIELRGPDIVATATSDDAYNALDQLVDKLDEQLRKRHEEIKDRRNHPQEIELDANLPKVGSEALD